MEITPSQQASQDAVQNLLDLYSTALRQEDIDRLQELLQPTGTPVSATVSRQAAEAAFMDAESFRQSVTDAMRALTFLDLQIDFQRDAIQVDSEPPQVTFLEVESALDPTLLTQRTRALATTFRLDIGPETKRDNDAQAITAFRISGVERQGPQFQIETFGPLLAGEPATVMATETTGTFSLSAVTLETCAESAQQLVNTGGRFQGGFTPLPQPETQSLPVCFHGTNSEGQTEQILVTHRYRVRNANDGMVQEIDGTGSTQFSAVAVAPDGTATGGGREPGFGATLYQVPQGGSTACLLGSPFANTNPESRVLDLAYDDLGRLHTIVFDGGSDDPTGPRAINGDLVLYDANDIDGDQFFLCPSENLQVRPVFCQTVNAFDQGQDYPLVEDPDPNTGDEPVSASTRVTNAADGDIWLFGSDGGVAQVQDNVGRSQCVDVEVQYGPVFRRQNSDIPTNSVPAFVVGSDGSLGFGTALGFTLRLPTGQFIRPLRRDLFVPQNLASLEAFFQEVANAIFDARPLATAGIGGVSFQELFGGSLIKEDIIFTAVEEQRANNQVPRRFWLGTLGGGLRRLEVRGETLQDTMLLTRTQVERINPDNGERTVILNSGISSNIIFALALDPTAPRPEEGDDVQTIWAATNEGVSRIHVAQKTVTITNFSPLDGLAVPVRDVAVTTEGVIWLATDAGLFRIVQ